MSLYHIEEELLRIFAHIEENDGEITEEMYAELNITKENLNAKLNNYVKAIKSWDADAVAAKDEAKKLVANAKVKENRIARLKKAMLQAVTLFGKDGTTGNKFIELPTVRLFTKASSAIETNDIRIGFLIGEFERYVRELVDNDILYTRSDVELTAILNSINANLKAEHDNHNVDILGMHADDEFIPFTLTDLTTLKIEITTTQTVYELFRTGKEALMLYGKNPINTKMRDHTAKEDWKTAISVADTMNTGNLSDLDTPAVSYPTVAKVIKNSSIQMK